MMGDVGIDMAGAQPKSDPSPSERASARVSEANASERDAMIAHEPTSIVGFKELHDAARAGRDQELSHLLGIQGLDVNAQDEKGYSALILAASKGHTECVQLLLGKGVDVSIATRDNFTCLHMAVFYGHIEVVNLLLHGKRRRKCFDHWDQSRNFLSCSDRRALMDRKSSSESFTALHLAAIGEHGKGVAIAASLLEAYRSSILEIYGRARNPKVDYIIDNELWLDYLPQIRNNLNLEDGDNSPAEATLKSLASYGNLNGFVLHEDLELLEKYEDLVRSYVELVSYSNARDRIGRTALHYAVWKRNVALVKFLTWDPDLGSVANVNTRDMDGYTPLHLASRNGSTDVARALHGLDGAAKYKLSPRQKLLDKKIYLQPSPAARPNHESRRIAKEILAALHKLGHQLNECDLENFAWAENRADVTPLHYAVEKGHTEIVELLVKHPKVDVFQRNGDGQSPWTIAFSPHLKLFQLRSTESQRLRFEKRKDIQRLLRSGSTTPCPKEEDVLPELRSYRQQLLKKAVALAVEVDREGDSGIEAARQLLMLEIQIFVTFLEKITGASGPNGELTSTCDKKFQVIDYVKRENSDCSWEEVMESYSPVTSITNYKESLSLLHVAAFEGCDEELQTLMRLKKYKNCINDCENITCSGYTALHFAIMECKADRRALKVLLKEEALNPTKKNTEGHTPLQVVDNKLEIEKAELSKSRLLASARRYFELLLLGFSGVQESREVLHSNRLVGARQLLMEHPEVKHFLEVLHKDLQRNANTVTSFMVGAALMATTSFNGWLHPPPVYAEHFENLFPSDSSSVDSPASSRPNSRRALIYWMLNSVSFVSALGAMLTAITVAVPFRSSYSDREMDFLYVQIRLKVISVYLAFSICCVLGAFADATRTGWVLASDTRGVFVGYFVMGVSSIVFFGALARYFLRFFDVLRHLIATSNRFIVAATISYIVFVAGCLVGFIKFTSSPAIYEHL